MTQVKRTQGVPLIYLLDDDPDFNRVLSMILGKLGMTVEMFTQGEDLVARVRTARPAMAIIDLNLGEGKSGFDVISEIRALGLPHFPMLVASADGNSISIAHALELGANDYLTKPFDKDVLASKLMNFFSSDRLDEASWGFSKSSGIRLSAMLELDLEIREVDEFGVKVTTPHLLQKGSAIMVGGPDLAPVFGGEKARLLNVASNWVETADSRYGSYLEFDFTDDELLRNVRNWIMNA